MQNPLGALAQTPFLTGKLVSREWLKFFQQGALASAVPAFITDTHANRAAIPASNYASGSIYFETDRQIAYIAVSGTWFYFVGTLQANQADLPTDLGIDDTNLLVNVTDYAHLLIWTGTGWTWAPGEEGSDFMLLFLTGPAPVTGWRVCDGSANIPKLNFDGTLSFVTVPTTANSWYRQ